LENIPAFRSRSRSKISRIEREARMKSHDDETVPRHGWQAACGNVPLSQIQSIPYA